MKRIEMPEAGFSYRVATATFNRPGRMRSIRKCLHLTTAELSLGIPPGFELLSDDLQKMVEKTAGAKSGRLEKFSVTAIQAILYFDSIAPRDSFDVRYRLRAKYPIHAQGFASRVYEHYDPNISATAKPVQFQVSGR